MQHYLAGISRDTEAKVGCLGNTLGGRMAHTIYHVIITHTTCQGIQLTGQGYYFDYLFMHAVNFVPAHREFEFCFILLVAFTRQIDHITFHSSH
mmetsp:Transcript_46771/g.70654  ORF Transcript_46771/g.70654 Transcript_46771/m.70654 type:complete len:94 (+) Transcript_46771:999-1280(+)